MAGIRDLRLGRIAFPTALNDLREQLGDELEVVGSAVTAGERRARSFQLTIPVYAAQGEDPERGDVLRRQVRALLDNPIARMQGLYLAFDADNEQNGFLMVGGGDLEYAEGGVTFGEYKLTLTNAYRVATLRTHRPARRLEIVNRNVVTTPRDIRGRIFSADFASITPVSVHVVPPYSFDLAGFNRAWIDNTKGFRRGKNGDLMVVPNRSDSEVLSYELPEEKVHDGGVTVWDRNGTAYDGTAPENDSPANTNTRGINYVKNPRPAPDVAGGSTPPETATTGYSLTAGGVLTNQIVGNPLDSMAGSPGGSRAFRIVTTGADQGAAWKLDGTFTDGSDLHLSFWAALSSGTAGVAYYLSHAGSQFGPTVLGSATVTTTWKRFDIPLTAWSGGAFSGTDVAFAIRPTSATTMFVTGLQVTNYRYGLGDPGPYFDGGFLGGAWQGAPYASRSTGYWGRLNLCQNPVAKTSHATVGVNLGATVTRSTAWGPRRGTSYRVVTPATQTSGAFFAFNVGSATGVNDSPSGRSCGFYARLKIVSGSVSVGADFNPERYVALGPGEYVIRFLETNLDVGSTGNCAFHFYTPSAVATEYFVTEVLIEPDATEVPSDFFDGDSQGAYWQGSGPPNLSVMATQPDREWGWEEVFGPNQPLTPGDIPVIENNHCRVRWVSAARAFALDAWQPLGGWKEVYRFCFFYNTTVPTILSAEVVELSDERGVIHVALDEVGLDRQDVYITLERGWLGPRVESYSSIYQARIVVAPYDSGGQHAMTPVGSRASADPSITTWDGGAINAAQGIGTQTVTTEPWTFFDGDIDDGFGLVISPLVTSNIYTIRTNWPYQEQASAERRGMMFTTLNPDPTSGFLRGFYVGVQLALVPSSKEFDASDYSSGSGTVSVVGDANAYGGTALRDTQATGANYSVTRQVADVATWQAGKYRVWARVRTSGTGTATVDARFSAGSISPGATTTSSTYVWLDLGEVNHNSLSESLGIVATISGGGQVFVDRVVPVLMENRTAATYANGGNRYDGARDQGALSLRENRPIPALVER